MTDQHSVKVATNEIGGGRMGPLAHLRILDFTSLVQGPMATQILGDLGADVIKIERPDGELGRHWGLHHKRIGGEPAAFVAYNRNKRSVSVDLKDPAALEQILSLVEKSDVVVENFRPGVMERLGLGYERLRNRNGSIIYASSSGWGRTGPYVERPGQDVLAQAASGMLTLQGRSQDPPTAVGFGIADLYTGMHLVTGILAALVHRERTGEGQLVEVDLFSCATAAQQKEYTHYLAHGKLPGRASRNTGAMFAAPPFGIYKTADGYIVIAVAPLPVLADCLELPELGNFNGEEVVDRRNEVFDLIEKRLLRKSTLDWLDILLEADVWAAPVQSYEEVIHDPQHRHNQLWWEVPLTNDEGAPETFRTVGSPLRLSLTPTTLNRGVPRLGEHNDEILRMLDEVGSAGVPPE